ncbi:putative protein phosphatase 2C homolog 1 [[Candida] railenensis]|uniref:PPM-type phosphatase domain-containing protein n=1 Tax=[Candida] railenensis TaxID=45579 RepID=A0A9P0QUV9_9ASCO|nr:putative protein phosphatase 2C homolog 1 [[Candida] railenensis]
MIEERPKDTDNSSSKPSSTSPESSKLSPTSNNNRKSKEKSSESTKDPFYGLSFTVGVAENKNVNYRATMEDVHTYVANFAERLDWGYFAIFDGHAGKQTARWCGNNLHTLLEKEIIKAEKACAPEPTAASPEKTSSGTSSSTSTTSPPKEPSSVDSESAVGAKTSSSDDSNKKTPCSIDSSAPLSNESDMREHMHNAFVKADELISKEPTGSSGSTAAVAVLRWETDNSKSGAEQLPTKDKPTKSQKPSTSTFDFVPQANHKRMLYTSNVGDSRIILSRKGKPYRLSYDHKATDVNEINRIKESGGLIMKNRVNGVLAVSRSLGDSYMKDLVIGKPYTTATEICEDDEFMILACDGLWDVISDLKAVQFVAKLLEQEDNPSTIAKKLCQLAMDSSTTDNVTIMIVLFDRSVFALGEAVKNLKV